MTTQQPAQPIEVRELRSDWHITLLAKGHVDPAQMIEAAKRELEGDIKGFSEPRHEWWRTYPKVQDGIRAPWFEQAKPNARGAFRCTVMVKDW